VAESETGDRLVADGTDGLWLSPASDPSALSRLPVEGRPLSRVKVDCGRILTVRVVGDAPWLFLIDPAVPAITASVRLS
jgi:hypothetical protein